jgi:DNA mismatch repair protein MutS
MSEATPMMRQYFEIKERNSDSILFFRLGDFYEMFGDDAVTASKELDLTLTSRDRRAEDPDGRRSRCAACRIIRRRPISGGSSPRGIRSPSASSWEDPATAKGLVDRDIVRVITPGTLIETSMLDEGKSNYLCALYVALRRMRPVSRIFRRVKSVFLIFQAVRSGILLMNSPPTDPQRPF